jgi:hypothetical protein
MPHRAMRRAAEARAACWRISAIWRRCWITLAGRSIRRHWSPGRGGGRKASRGGCSTRSYLANLGSGQVDLAVDHTENCHLFWASARDALAAAAREELHIIFPTRATLNVSRSSPILPKRPPMPPLFRFGRSCRKPWCAKGSPGCPSDGHGYPVLGEPLAQARRA